MWIFLRCDSSFNTTQRAPNGRIFFINHNAREITLVSVLNKIFTINVFPLPGVRSVCTQDEGYSFFPYAPTQTGKSGK